MKRKRTGINTATNTAERGIGKDIDRPTSPTHDEIALLAFSLYESRGRQDGRAMEDWVQAEQQLMRYCA
ncbi:MAG TPA: DUF2934 domain-containing protein [Terriglobales bacterium]|nr:DUF2934 domain-containing protein [Terriglobales bacterium]